MTVTTAAMTEIRITGVGDAAPAIIVIDEGVKISTTSITGNVGGFQNLL
jgi:hypothetical protein